MTPASALRAIAALTLVATSMNASANILLNPGFEDGSGTDATDWNELSGPSGSVTRSGEQPKSGAFSARMEIDNINNPPAGAAYFIEQMQPAGSIDPTKNYDLSFQARSATDNFDGIDMFYQILWLDLDASDGGGVKGESLIPLIPAGLNTSYQLFTLLDINVPDTADSFLLRFQASAGAVPNIANTLYIDDASLAITGGTPLFPGDANNDGTVDLIDLSILASNFQGPNTPYAFADGDFNSDGLVDLVDLSILATNFGASSPAPEPASALLLTTGLLALRRRSA